MNFDPDAYLAQTAPANTGGFDPDTYLNQTAPQIGQLESFGRAAANNVPLAPQAIAAGESLTGIGDEGGYSKNLANWNARAAEAKAANPKTYGAGAVAGALAPMAIPGVGSALRAAPITGNAIYGAANAISNTDLLKNPGLAAKEAAVGAGIGAGTAGLINALTPEAASLENVANKTALKSLDMPAGQLVDMTPQEREALAQFAREKGLVGADKVKVLKNARGLLDEYGQKIGELGEKSEELGLHVNPDEHYQAVQNLLGKSEQFGGLANREAKNLARSYKAGANDILNLPDNPSWADIQKLKDQYGGLAFKSTGEVKDLAAKDTYFALKDMLKGIADKAHGNPNMPGEYKQALAGYSQMHPIVSGMEKAVDAELRGGGRNVHGLIGLIKKLPGPVRGAIGAAGAMTGHPHYALAAALPEILNPAIQSQAIGGLARNIPKVRQGLTQELMDYLTSKYGENQVSLR